MKYLSLGIVLMWLMSSIGCHSESSSEQVAAAQVKQQQPSKKEEPEDPLAKMAQAVGSGKPGAAVQLRYDILAKPQQGLPFEIELALVPQVDADVMTTHIGGMDGLTLSGDLEPKDSEVKFQQIVKHRFTVTASHEGVFYATITASLVQAGATMSRTFTVPMVVGTPTAAEKPTAALKHDATGQVIQSMPAQESK